MNTKNILRWIVLIGLFAIPTTIPFIVSSTMFFPFITGKAFTFRIIVEIIFTAWLLLAMMDKKYRPKFSLIISSITVFIGVLFIADLLAENPQKAFWSNFERMEGFVALFHMALYFLVLGSTLITEKLWIYFWRANVLTSLVLSGYGFLQLLGKIQINQGGVRVDGTLGNAAYFAGYMLFTIFIALFLLARDNKTWWKWLYSLSIVCNLIIIYNSATRGALLGLIGGLVLTTILVAIFGKEYPKFRKISGVVAILIVLISGIFFLMKDSKFVQSHPPLSRLTSINMDSADAEARFMVWDMAFKGFKDRPILGWGQEGFNFVFNKYYNPDMYGREQWFDRTHNIVLDWLIAGGALGLLSYLSLIIFALIYVSGVAPKFIKNKMEGGEILKLSLLEKTILIGLLAGYFFQNLFVFDHTVSYILFFSLLAFLHSNRSKAIRKLESAEEVSVQDINSFFLYVAIITLVVILWFVNIKHILAAKDLIRAISSHKEGPTKNLEYFKSALGRNSFANQEIREQLGQMASVVIPNASVSESVKKEVSSLTLSEMEKHVKLVPEDPRMRIFLGSFQSMIGSNGEAIKQFEEALKLSPQKQVIKVGLASEYLRVGEFVRAFEMMKSAYESAPQFKDIASSYLITAMYTQNKDYINEVVNNVFDGKIPDDTRLIQVYIDTKNGDKAIALAKKIASQNPTDIQAELRLAEVYLQLGMKYKTIEIIKNLIAKNPSLKEQGEQLIKQVESLKN